MNEKNMKKIILFFFLLGMHLCSCAPENKTIWEIGVNDNSGNEFALAPKDYTRFIEKDFGWEDKYFLIGTSNVKKDWPYILPGTSDTWAGTWEHQDGAQVH